MQDLMPSLNSSLNLLAFIIGFGFIIFVHELGHFLAAKAVGIKTTQFAIGFGHALLTFRRGLGLRVGSSEKEYQRHLAGGVQPENLGETEYRLNWIPFGGYVKMLGQEDLDPTATSDDERAFNRKPIWARAVVVSAGVVMNLVFALVFFVVAFTAGVSFPPAVVGDVALDMPAANVYANGHKGDPAYAGLLPGDRITHINDKPIQDFMELAVSAALSEPQTPLRLTIQREGLDQPLFYSMTPRADALNKLLSLGIDLPLTTRLIRILETDRLYTAGVRPDMVISAMNGQAIHSYGQYHRALRAAQGLPVQVTFADPRSGQEVTVDIKASAGLTPSLDHPPHLIGFIPATVISAVQEGSPAQQALLMEGDLIASLDGEPWPLPEQIRSLVGRAGDRSVAISVWRDGELHDLGPVKPDADGKLGVLPGLAVNRPVVGQTLPNSPAATLHLTGGSIIRTINDQTVENWSDMQRLLQEAVAKSGGGAAPVKVTYELNVKGSPRDENTMEIDAEAAVALLSARWLDPLANNRNLSTLRVPVAANNPISATKLGVEKTHQFMVQTYITIMRLAQGTVKLEHLRGPVGIVHEGTKVAQEGWTYLLFFLGLISVNLVVINFLPIPITDGGLMIFLIIEKFKGSPVSPRIQTAATVVGLALIASLFLVTLFFDTGRLFGFQF